MRVRHFFYFSSKCQTVFKNGFQSTDAYSHEQCVIVGVSCFTFLPVLQSLCLSCYKPFHCGFNWHFPNDQLSWTNFHILIAFYISSFMKFLLKILIHFSIEFILLISLNFSPLQDTWNMYVYSSMYIFSLFSLGVFWWAKFFILTQWFSFILSFFFKSVISKTKIRQQGHKIITCIIKLLFTYLLN